MNKNFTFLFAIFATIILTGCNKVNSLTCNGLKGHVKSVTSNCYYATERFGEIEKGKLIRESDYWIPLYAERKLEFDQKGNLLKETILDNYGDITQVTKYEYIDNTLVAWYMYGYDGELSSSWKIIFENDKPISVERFSKYEEPDGEICECVFDGLLLKTEKYYRDGILVKKEEQEFKNNLWCKSITTDAEGNITFQAESEHTKSGQITYNHYIVKGENAIEEHIEYNEKNLPIQHSRVGMWSDGDMVCTFNYTSFDQKGNWLTRVVYKDDKLYVVEERTVEYYQ